MPAASAITRLPSHLRTPALNKLSANANASGGSKRQYGRAPQTAARGLRNALGIYLIETNQTGTLAYSIGGATPETITVELGTPASVSVLAGTPPALIPVTWAGGGVRNLTVQTGNYLAGNARLVVT